MKGPSENGRIERNLVASIDKDIAQQGERIRISFGGGTPKRFRRDKRYITEHNNGIVANYNDIGVYLNQSSKTQLAHNTLLYTLGIDVRFPTSSATTYGNRLDGRIKNEPTKPVGSEMPYHPHDFTTLTPTKKFIHPIYISKITSPLLLGVIQPSNNILVVK